MDKRLAVAVSGTGSLLEAMIADGLIPVLVTADRPCRGLEIARAAGIKTRLIERSFGIGFDRIGFTQEFMDEHRRERIELIGMAGFMTILTARIFELFPSRILNIHPSLLPSFKGDHAVRDTLRAGVKITGTTVHVMTEKLDNGPIIAQEAVRVEDGDTEAVLHERIKRVERFLYPKVIRSYAATLQ